MISTVLLQNLQRYIETYRVESTLDFFFVFNLKGIKSCIWSKRCPNSFLDQFFCLFNFFCIFYTFFFVMISLSNNRFQVYWHPNPNVRPDCWYRQSDKYLPGQKFDLNLSKWICAQKSAFVYYNILKPFGCAK